MTKGKNKQSGFSIVEALIVVAAIGILGLSSWAVYQHVKTSTNTAGAAQNPNQTTQQTPATPAPTVSYLEIKEWGIKLPLSDSIKDATYPPAATIVDDTGAPAAMWVSVNSLAAEGCALSNNGRDGNGTIGEIMRITPGQTDGVTGELLTKEFPNGTTIGSYYYAYKSWASRNTCASAAEQQAPDAAFASAVNGHIQASTTTPTN